MTIGRRDFLKSAALGSTLLHTGVGLPLGLAARRARSMTLPTHGDPILVNITLDGGPDFRHLLPPAYSAESGTFGGKFWYHRAPVYGLESSDAAGQAAAYDAKYYPMSLGGVSFGLLRNCGWLYEQINAGNVAIINNVGSSENRDHSHSLIMWESGVATAGRSDFDRSGWGGRLAAALGGGVVSTTGRVRLFCNGPSAASATGHDNTKVTDFADSRNVALYEYEAASGADADEWKYHGGAILGRALKSYYAAKRDAVAADSPFAKIIGHEKRLREFGATIKSRLGEVGLPDALKALYYEDSEAGIEPSLNHAYFGLQLRNLYDALSCGDILGSRVYSCELRGWDSHKLQVDNVEPKLADLFGASGGLATLMSQLGEDMPDAAENIVFVVGGEFGRQLAANGDKGTDHGKGNSVLVIGSRVKGGVYGSMFPDADIAAFDVANTDITPKTSVQQVYARICEHMLAGAAATVFPDLSTAAIESAGLLDDLLR